MTVLFECCMDSILVLSVLDFLKFLHKSELDARDFSSFNLTT